MLDAAIREWLYISRYVIDRREGGEWFSCLDENGKPVDKPTVEPWKCPYHNGRMLIEVLENY